MNLSRSRMLPLVIAGVLLVLLVALAHLQWRWVGEVCQLERHRLERTLVALGSRVTDDVDHEVRQIFAALHPDFGAPTDERTDELVDQLARWRASARHPGLVGGIYRLGPDRAGADPPLERLVPEARRFVEVAWPPSLAGLRTRPGGPSTLGHPGSVGGLHVVDPELAVLLIPFDFPRWSTAHGREPHAGAVLVVELDLATFVANVMPEIVRAAQAWSPDEDVTVAVIDPSRPDRVLYRSDPAAPADRRDADLCLPLLAARPTIELLLPMAHGAHRRGAPAGGPMAGCAAVHGDDASGWRLLLGRRGASVEEAVARLRWHNLGASLGILALLAATAVVLVATTQRAQRLARQQIEFVAGVTHELHTPLTAIRSAGENLADGVVAEPAQVRRYGVLIEGEGRRLSSMVGHILELAGIQSGRRLYRLEPVEVKEIVDRALHEARWLIEGAAFTVERDVAEELPAVLADAVALRRAVHDLIENAVKYGGAARWLRVRARATATGVDLSIADRGPGIPRDERPRLFEPFFRGREAAASGAPGAGLGLALVQKVAFAHGARVSVTSETEGETRGTVVTLHLPAAPALRGPAAEEAA